MFPRAKGGGPRASKYGSLTGITALLWSLILPLIDDASFNSNVNSDREGKITGGAIGIENYIKGHTLYEESGYSKFLKTSNICKSEDIKGII